MVVAPTSSLQNLQKDEEGIRDGDLVSSSLRIFQLVLENTAPGKITKNSRHFPKFRNRKVNLVKRNVKLLYTEVKTLL